MVTVAVLAITVWHHRVMGGCVLGLAAATLVVGFCAPKAYRAVQRGLGVFAHWVGRALTWLLLVPFFYLVFTPARVLLFLRGKDPMSRTPDPEAASYWLERPPVPGPEHYTRQY